MEAGTVLAERFRIERLLGRGGMASVYEATQLDLNRRVAVKLLSDEQDAIPSIEREARAAAQLAHPHIVQVTEVVKPLHGAPFLVMELLDGESLDERIARMGPLAPDRAAFIAVQVLSALASAHASGIIHRDVKPANVFLTRTAATNDFVKLLDFGIARRTTGVVSSKSGRRGGTPAYMAPEQIVADAEVDARTDIWALGVCLYEMIAGAPPFAAKNIPSLLVKICEASAPPLATDLELAAIVTRAMAKEPGDRFESAEDMRRALLPIARADDVPSAHAGPLPSLSPEQKDAPTMTAPTPRIKREEDSRETKRSGATMASAPPAAMEPRTSNRGFVFGALGAISALAIAMVISNRASQHAPLAPITSATAAAVPRSVETCTLGTPLAPWPVDRRRIAVSALPNRVLLATNTASGPPRYASGSTKHLEEWKFPPYIPLTPNASFSSDATATEDEVVGVAIKVVRDSKKPETMFNLFTPKLDAEGRPTWGRIFTETVDVKLARVAVVRNATIVVLAGFGLVEAMGPKPFPHVRLIRRHGTDADDAVMPEIELPDDLALAATPDRIAFASTFSDKVVFATYDVADLHALAPRTAKGQPENGQVAIHRGETLGVWSDTAAHELRFMQIRGMDLVHDGMLARGEIPSHAVASTGEKVILAFAKKVDAATTIFVGSGSDLREAAASVDATRSVIGRPITQVRLANAGKSVWLAWTEATGDESAIAQVARLECP